MKFFAHASLASLSVTVFLGTVLSTTVLLGPALGQGTAGLFDDNALSITDNQSRFELALDANGDGELELLDWWPYLGHGGTISVGLYHRRFHPGSWWERGRAATGPDGNYHGDTATRAGDLDGDGDDEVVIVSRGQVDVFDLFGFEMQRRLEWMPSSALTGTYREAAILDFTGDGRDDLVVVDGTALRLLESSGTGGAFAFTETASLPNSDVDVEIEVADVVGSSTPDLFVLVPGDAPVLWIMDVDGGQFQSAERIDVRAPAGGAKLSLAIGDLDGDGDTDAVLFGHDGRFQVVRNLRGDAWSLEQDAVGGPATDLADLDLDGDLDGICCGSGGTGDQVYNDVPSTFHLCLNDGTGSFDVAVPFAGVGGHHVAAALDWDLDGDIDVVGGTHVLLNKSAVGGSFCTATPNSTGGPAVAYATGTPSESAGGVHLYGTGLPPGTTCILLAHGVVPDSTQAPHPFWDGQLCILGPYLARRHVAFADANGNVDLGHRATWTSPLCCEIGWGAERLWGYQIWFRDAAPGGTGGNVSNALTVMISR